ncbi:MAG: hypothetical protein ACYDB1_04055 [Acidiferrobacteraceae bacterium]
MKVLLFIIERGGYPVCAERFTRLGYRVIVERSMRKALALLKSASPDVVIAEFNFGPRYGDRISNLEPLFARIETGLRAMRVIALADAEYWHHLETLRERFPVFDTLMHPVTEDRLVDCVSRAAQS